MPPGQIPPRAAAPPPFPSPPTISRCLLDICRSFLVIAQARRRLLGRIARLTGNPVLITSSSANPNPVSRGSSLHVAIDFETQQTIRSGTLTTTVRWGSRPVWRARRQLCDHVMCPIPPGTFQLASVKSIPWIAPNGDYRLDVHGAMLLTGGDPHHLQADTEKVGEGQEEKEKNVRVQIPFKIK